MDIELSAPEHVTADFLGEAGQRTFYLQASEQAETVSILLEKAQVAGIAQVLTELLAGVGAEPVSSWDIESMRLRMPVTPRWRAGAVAVGLEPELGRFLIEVTELVPEDENREPEQVRIWISEDQARVVAAHAAWSVAQGRPTCQLCGLPIDPGGHHCPRLNGTRNP